VRQRGFSKQLSAHRWVLVHFCLLNQEWIVCMHCFHFFCTRVLSGSRGFVTQMRVWPALRRSVGRSGGGSGMHRSKGGSAKKLTLSSRLGVWASGGRKGEAATSLPPPESATALRSLGWIWLNWLDCGSMYRKLSTVAESKIIKNYQHQNRQNWCWWQDPPTCQIKSKCVPRSCLPV
jgi:hypothetical protein